MYQRYAMTPLKFRKTWPQKEGLALTKAKGFDTDEELLGYFLIHSMTDRAMFHWSQVWRLLELAGKNPPEREEGDDEFFPICFSEAESLAADVRARLKAGK